MGGRVKLKYRDDHGEKKEIMLVVCLVRTADTGMQ
jgi:hypothetical protein